ncbi:AAA family ATPase [Propionivibrio sp.]|uniref:MinD/ParA family ATP-binding protein n=1 Tax=Propionivibrio sp. TaxID=2212460 RepID=UPI00260F7AAE|nr:AAA family ATPase [Propionivibrio sp.]
MAECHSDQAAGLRRLFCREQTRIVTFAAGSVGVGKSILVANLAASLARQGKEVLVLDENTKNNVASCYGALARHDLLQVINREKVLAEVLLTVAPGVSVLPAARAVKKLGKLSPRQQNALLETITGMERSASVILVDASLDHPLGFSPLGLAAHDTVIVLSASSASITDAYALIKKVSLGYARKDFRILVNKVRGSDEAVAIHGNIAKLTHSRGLARLEYSGFVPLDEQLRQASRLCQPVEGLFPDAPAAKAYRTIGSNLLNWPLPGESMGGVGGIEQFVQQLLHLSQHIDPIAIYA